MLRPVCGRLQPGGHRGGRHQHRRPPAIRSRDVQEDENCTGRFFSPLYLRMIWNVQLF